MIAWLAVLGLAPAVTLYVATNGRDSWSGKLATPNRGRTDGPLATVDGARLLIRKRFKESAVTVYILPGRYEVTKPVLFEPEDSGTAAAPRRYSGAFTVDKKAVLSGMAPITGWRKQPNGWLVTNLPEVKSGKWDFVQLFVNGERRYRPRLPKKGYFTIAEHADPTPESKGKGNDRFQFSGSDISADWANRDDVDICAFHEWIMSRNRIKAVDGNVVTFKAPTGTDAPWRDFLKGHRFLVENVKEALSEPGEWYLDRSTGDLTYIPKPGESVANLRFEAPRASSLIEFRGDPGKRKWVEHIVVAGLDLEGTNWTAPAEGRNFPQAEADLSGAVRFVGARNCQFDGNVVSRTGGYAVEVGPACKNIQIAKNHFLDLGAGGVKIGEMAWQKDPELITERCSVVANIMRAGGRMHPAAVGVWIGQNPHNHVGGNFIHDFYYTGISVGWSWGYQENGAHHNTIESNRIGDIGQGVLSDMGGIYTLGPQAGTIIRGNRIHDIQSFSYGGWGIYPDEGSTGILIENNCVFRTKSAGFHQHYGRENVIRNNVFAFGTEAQIMRTRAEDHLSFTAERNIVLWDKGPLLGSNWQGNNYRLDRNLYWRVGGQPFDFAGMSLDSWRAKGQDAGSIVADPLFRDPDSGDFRLRPESPAHRLEFQSFAALEPGFDREVRQKAPRAWP